MRRALSLFLIFSFFFAFFALPAEAQSASLYLNPSSSSYTLGTTFTVDVKVNTGGVAINAAEGTLVYDTNAFESVSISKSGSVFTLWTQDPVVSPADGTISFGGGIPNPGFSGSGGKLFSISLKVRTTGTGIINWSSGAVLANDGKGTNILASIGGGSYKLNPSITTPPAPAGPTIPAPAPTTATGVPAAPEITSSTHPDPNQWYAKSNPSFEWELPAGVTGVSFMLTESLTSNPGPLSDGLVTSKTFENIKDAIHYFHIKFRNRRGWGEITHRRVLIDTVAPESFKIAVYDNGDPTNPTPEIQFKTKDAVSGISYYEVKIGNDNKEKMAGVVVETNPYKPAPLPAGRHTVVVEAFDGAANSTAATTEFIIKPIETPVITEYPAELQIGDTLTIKGTFIPNGITRVYVQKEGEEADKKEIKANKEGNWTYVHERSLERGVYRVWTEGIDSRGAQSYPSDKINIAVKLPALFKIGKLAVDYLSVMVSLLAIIALIVIAIFFGWYRMAMWRKRLRREVREAEESVQKAFDALYEDIRDNLEALENVKTEKDLSREEKKLLKKMKGALDVAERYIGKEIKDVEKELE